MTNNALPVPAEVLEFISKELKAPYRLLKIQKGTWHIIKKKKACSKGVKARINALVTVLRLECLDNDGLLTPEQVKEVALHYRRVPTLAKEFGCRNKELKEKYFRIKTIKKLFSK